MELQKLRDASEKALDFLTRQLDDQGRLKNEEAVGELGAVYKLPYLLILTGNGRLAHKVLNDIKARFMQKNGDFMSYPLDRNGNDRKSDAPELSLHWAYMNAWIAMAAHRLGRFDISHRAWEFIQQFYNPKVGGFGTSGRYKIKPDMEGGLLFWSGGDTFDVGFFMTSFLGALALMIGDMKKARTSGDLLVRMVEQQPALDRYFLLHASGETGELQSDLPESLKDYRPFYALVTDRPQELFFQLGYPVYYLLKLSQVTKIEKYLHTAEKILDFVLTCHEGFYSNFLSHKVAWAAGQVAMATGKQKYREMSARVVEYLLSLQTSEGDMLRDLGTRGSLDQTTEIAIWLRELADALIDKEVL